MEQKWRIKTFPRTRSYISQSKVMYILDSNKNSEAWDKQIVSKVKILEGLKHLGDVWYDGCDI